MVTRVRQRLVRDREHRRGRKVDPAWAHRMLLLRGYNTLSGRGKTRLQAVFDLDDPTDELSAAWGVKEQLRRLLHSRSVDEARREKMTLGRYVLAADMDETTRLWNTICAWRPAIEVLIATGVTNARTEAAIIWSRRTRGVDVADVPVGLRGRHVLWSLSMTSPMSHGPSGRPWRDSKLCRSGLRRRECP